MSLKVVLKNIYSFLDILQAASGFDVVSWNIQALENAFQWAQYCQQIFRQSQGKQYESELANYVIEIGDLPWGIYIEEPICLQTLAKAQDLLLETLRRNKLTPEEIVYQISQKFPSDVANQFQGADVHLFQARILLSQIIAFQNLPLTRQQKCRQMVMNKLKALTEFDKLETLLTSLSTDAQYIMLSGKQEMKIAVIKKAQDYVLYWMLYEKENWSDSICTLHCHVILCDLSTQYLSFYKYYLKCLIEATNALEPEIDTRGIISFRCTHGNVQLSNIQAHIESLLKTKGHVGLTTHQALQTLCHTDTTGVWRTLCGHLKDLE